MKTDGYITALVLVGLMGLSITSLSFFRQGLETRAALERQASRDEMEFMLHQNKRVLTQSVLPSLSRIPGVYGYEWPEGALTNRFLSRDTPDFQREEMERLFENPASPQRKRAYVASVVTVRTGGQAQTNLILYRRLPTGGYHPIRQTLW